VVEEEARANPTISKITQIPCTGNHYYDTCRLVCIRADRGFILRIHCPNTMRVRIKDVVGH